MSHHTINGLLADTASAIVRGDIFAARALVYTAAKLALSDMTCPQYRRNALADVVRAVAAL